MDINYLLALQNFRESSGQWLIPLMNYVSMAANYIFMIIPMIIFWDFSRENGYFYLLSLGITNLVNNVLKLAACIYRPWIRDTRIHPAEVALADATGYSFPSGHTVSAASVLGAIGFRFFKNKKGLSLFLYFLVLLVAFSRNFLGVHTPQDVLVAILESFVIIALMTCLAPRLHGNEKLQDMFTIIGFAVVAVSILFIELKPYPMDYADGVLLVDPESQKKDVYLAFGVFIGFLIGSLWERKFIHYDPSGSGIEKILRAIIGALLALFCFLVIRRKLAALLGMKIGTMLGSAILGFVVIGLYPFLIMKVKAALDKSR